MLKKLHKTSGAKSKQENNRRWVFLKKKEKKTQQAGEGGRYFRALRSF